MSQELIEKVRRGHDAFNRGDLEPARALVTEDVEWNTTGAFPGMEHTYRGAQALDDWMETQRSAWEEFEVSLDEVLHDGSDAVVVAEKLWGKGRGSGVEVEMRVYSVYRFNSAGLIYRRAGFNTAEEALDNL